MQKKIRKWKHAGRIDKLKKVLVNENYQYRIEAIKALGELSDKSAVSEIKILINDPIKGVILAAADSLKKLDAETSIQKAFELRILEIENQEKKQSDRRKENWKEKTEEEIQEDLERRAKMIGLNQVDKRARSIHHRNAKHAAVAKSIGKLFGV